MRLPGITCYGMVLALSLSACAITAPTTSESPTAVASESSAAPSPTESAPSPTPTESTELELRGDGIGAYSFGAAEADVVTVLEAELGQPDDTFEGVACELDSSSPWMESLRWGDLWVRFSAKGRSKTAPRTLSSWGIPLPGELPGDLTMQEGVPLDLSFAELKKQFPGGKSETVTPGTQDVLVYTLPNGIEFSGVKRPQSVMAGELGMCE